MPRPRSKTKKSRRGEPKPGKVGSNRSLYKPCHLVPIYRYARRGMGNAAIGEALGLHKDRVTYWEKKIPEVAEALRLAREDLLLTDDFSQYCYARMPEDLKAVWDSIMRWEYEPGGSAQVQAILADHGERVRQQLYLHALLYCSFSPRKAAAKVGIDRDVAERWARDSPEFAQLVQEVQKIKGDFFEESLIKLIQQGDRQAVLFANKTYNRSRGYGDVRRLEVEGTVQHQHDVLDLDELLAGVSEGCRAEVLLALRRREENTLRASRPPEERLLEQLSEEIANPPEVAGGVGDSPRQPRPVPPIGLVELLPAQSQQES